MVFSSITFIVFFALVCAALLFLRLFEKKVDERYLVRVRHTFLLIASYVFYGWWDWRFLGLIALTTAASFASGLLLERYDGRERRRRWITAANIVQNLGILALFKYYDFFADNLSAVLRALGFRADLPTLRLILPVGISFYTFQALSYTIDVHRHQLRATRDVLAFFAYIAFFPQLVAGPIERATHLLPQMLRARTFNYTAAADGLRQMLWGFAKKMLVADTCALAVDIIWQSPGEQSALALAVGAVLFSVQIYGDFSGYSDIAVGCARLFGIQLMQNFRTPYFAASITDFWRRWHISLMTWLRDYVYIPLGGNRCSRLRQYANTLTTFLLSGLWHGAAWTYVFWGLYHGLLVCIEKALKTLNSPKLSTLKTLNLKTTLRSSLLAHSNKVSLENSKLSTLNFIPFLLVSFGWLLFRAPDLSAFAAYCRGFCHLSSLFAFSTLTMGKSALLWSAALLLIEWLQRSRAHALDLPACGILRHRAVRWAVYYALILLILFCHADEQAFIYFQF